MTTAVAGSNWRAPSWTPTLHLRRSENLMDPVSKKRLRINTTNHWPLKGTNLLEVPYIFRMRSFFSGRGPGDIAPIFQCHWTNISSNISTSRDRSDQPRCFSYPGFSRNSRSVGEFRGAPPLMVVRSLRQIPGIWSWSWSTTWVTDVTGTGFPMGKTCFFEVSICQYDMQYVYQL